MQLTGLTFITACLDLTVSLVCGKLCNAKFSDSASLVFYKVYLFLKGGTCILPQKTEGTSKP